MLEFGKIRARKFNIKKTSGRKCKDGDGKFSKTMELNPDLFVFAYWYEFFSLNLFPTKKELQNN
jgi:hypothetical protein